MPSTGAPGRAELWQKSTEIDSSPTQLMLNQLLTETVIIFAHAAVLKLARDSCADKSIREMKTRAEA